MKFIAGFNSSFGLFVHTAGVQRWLVYKEGLEPNGVKSLENHKTRLTNFL